ncbi:MAG: hypothetical protein H6510_14595 [Acidobacteria bacterium]|nr:hypothetical protein [Acidobacteriota bacterium]MCB9399040.1 hypothetical protein [Acidobacteriota bacterium]
MLTIQEAVEKARLCFREVYQKDSIAEILLKEVALSDDSKYWLVSLSFDWQPKSGTSSLGPGSRRHKQVRLDAETGQMLSIKTPQQHN